jgi:hypothetical protein
MMTQTLIGQLANAIVAHNNCVQSGNEEWQDKWADKIRQIEREELPSGSGIDSGTKVDMAQSDGRTKIVLTTAYHHMDENGMYAGWTHHRVVIVADLLFGFSLRITGKDHNQIKDYLHDVFSTALSEEYADATVEAIQP